MNPSSSSYGIGIMRTIGDVTRAALLAASLLLAPGAASAQQSAQQNVRIGLGAPTLSFLPIWAARALDTFAPQGLTVSVAALPGDTSALAALDAGDIDLAAVGTDALLRAAAKGQPFEMVYTVMSKVTAQLVVSPALLKRTGVTAADPLPKRLAALKGALVGVTSLAGTQENAARWLAAKGGLDPKADIKVAQVGSPVAVQAALEVGRIDAFVLSPPEGYNAEKAGTGVVLVSLGEEFPLLARTARALRAAGSAVVAKPEETAAAIQKPFFAKASPDAIAAAVKAMASGAAGGSLDAAGVQNALTFAEEVGAPYGRGTDAKAAEDDLWTNRFAAAADAP